MVTKMKTKVNSQQAKDLIRPGASFPVTDNGDGGLGNHHPPNQKVAFDPAIMLMQLKELDPDLKLKVKTSKKQVTAVNIFETDKVTTVTINPAKWRGHKKVAFLEDWITKTVAGE